MGIDSLKVRGVSENSHVCLVESVNCHISLHLSNPYCSSTTYIIDTCKSPCTVKIDFMLSESQSYHT